MPRPINFYRKRPTGSKSRRLLFNFALLPSILLLAADISIAGGKLLATPGVSQIEGSAGGGLVPWAQLAGYASDEQVSVSGYCTRVQVKDFSLNSCGTQANFFDRLELSYAEQRIDVEPLSIRLEQAITGAKFRLFGGLVYGPSPQVSLGLQHKHLKTDDLAFALGAKDNRGTDVYLAASKLHLGAIFGYNLLWNLSARHSDANELGLLGFGGPEQDKQWLLEGAVAVLVNQHLAIGAEYRQKPSHLHLDEHDWYDLFVAYFPNKHISITAAYVDLGSIALLENQTGWYLSLMAYY